MWCSFPPLIRAGRAGCQVWNPVGGAPRAPSPAGRRYWARAAGGKANRSLGAGRDPPLPSVRYAPRAPVPKARTSIAQGRAKRNPGLGRSGAPQHQKRPRGFSKPARSSRLRTVLFYRHRTGRKTRCDSTRGAATSAWVAPSVGSIGTCSVTGAVFTTKSWLT